MHPISTWLAYASVLLGTVQAHENGNLRPKYHGFIGYGIPMWQPTCAFACRQVLRSNSLACSTPHPETNIASRHGVEALETSPECFASDDAYLLSLALCLDTRCNETETWELERFWFQDAVGWYGADPPVPKIGYADALLRVKSEVQVDALPAATMSGHLSNTSTVSFEDWHQTYLADSDTSVTEKNHVRSGFVVVGWILAVPVLVHILRLVPIPQSLQRTMRSRLGYSALFGHRHSVPLPYDVGILPTRGQTLFILFVVVLNTVLLFTGYKISDGAGEAKSSVLMKYIANRAGVLSFANLSLMMLCSARNNVAVRFTKWSYSTMLLYHRWIAYICIVQAALHTGIWLYRHIGMLLRKFSEPYWIWGTIGMVAMLVIMPLSCLPVRRQAYELFLDSHVFLSFATLLGLYYHIYEAFGHRWGHENWIYAASLLWIFDHFLRLIKLVKHGMPTADVTYLDDEYAKIYIPNVKAAGHVYLYFPTLDWRIWQNHPFSIANSIIEGAAEKRGVFMPVTGREEDFELGELLSHDEASPDAEELKVAEDIENAPTLVDEDQIHTDEHHQISITSDASRLLSRSANRPPPGRGHHNDENNEEGQTFSTGVTIYVRRQRGITARLFQRQPRSLPVLIEGSYRPLPIPNIATAATLVCIAGGVGISTVLPTLHSHASLGRTALYWSSRSRELVEDVALPTGIVARIKIQERWNTQEVVLQEAFRANPGGGEMIVMVSGPNQMADDVRAAVVKANDELSSSRERSGLVVRLAEECFSW